MILLVTSAKKGNECAKLLEKALTEGVELVDSGKKAAIRVRNDDYTAIVLDEWLVESEGDTLDTILQNSGMAVPVYVNFAITSAERMVRDVKCALRRYQESKLVAVRAAETQLRSEIRDAVTGIVLSAELALEVPDLPMEAEQKMKSVCHLATQIRSRLETVQ